MIAATTLTYRRIDPDADADLVVGHHREACIATFGDSWRSRYEGPQRYLQYLRAKVEEFPDGCVLACLGGGGGGGDAGKETCVGQMELQVPYGLAVGYVNLYYITPSFRRLGLGRLMHREYAERYFRAWEAERIELHVSPTNARAVRFYRRLGYEVVGVDGSPVAPLWRMAKAASATSAK